METEALKHQLETERDAIKGYLLHPFTQQIFQDSAEEQESIIALICENPISSIETFFSHFEAVGHLRGLRRSKSLVMDNLAVIEQQLKELLSNES